MRKVVVNIARVVLAVVLILSGFVKAVDPLGTQYKIADYLGALHLAQYIPDAMMLGASVLLSAFEFMLGTLLLLAIRRRTVSLLTLLLFLVMTPLTLWLALANPVSDCGCFGDALVLTNWQTFWKNVVLLALALIVWRYPLQMVRFVSQSNQWIVINYTAIFILVVSGWSLYDLPYFDFRPYHIGANIRQGMEIPDDAEQPQFETTFILEKDGQRQEFTTDNYPDSTWTFIDSKTVQLSEGYVPPIHDFSITRVSDGEDITDSLLNVPGYVFLLVSPQLRFADDSQLDLINQIYEYAEDNGYPFYGLTASGDKDIEHWQERTGAEYPFCQTDETTLKTVIRSNPGLLLLKNGTVIRKWSHNRLPDEYALTAPLEKLETGQIPEDSVPGKILVILLWYVLPLALLVLGDRWWAWSRWIKRKEESNIIFQHLTKRNNNMRKKIVAGNWKMNLNLQEGIALAKELNDALKADKPNCDVVICTPFIHLASVANVLEGSVIGLGAENCADKEKGAFTGEVSAEMVKSTGAQYVILGHSERREYYKETPEILKEKVLLALKNGLKVIFCIGETLAEREANKQNEVVKAELEGSVFNLSEADFKNIIIAYEPIWAIGTGKTATAEQAEEIHAYIRSIVAEKYGEAVADDTSILYGGSCKASNAPELFAKPDIDGGLIGGASLKCSDFKGIIDAWK
ncbi:MAG: triose-phosphate isomerase [Prevotella sp.]|nr:triose-phosphate isomerase [Prevotella sp.]